MEPYNPLDKRNLGKSVAEALLDQQLVDLPMPGMREGFVGAGVYAIYYFGEHAPYPPYRLLAERNRNAEDVSPIYVGKAIPAGARKAGVGLDVPVGTVLFNRLREHAESIRDAMNLDLRDFKCRFLLVDDIWIPLGESLVIQRFEPLWNVVVDGFGNHDPGSGRLRQQRSAWDTIHPGRAWAARLMQPHRYSEAQIVDHIERALSGKSVEMKSVREAMEEEEG